MGTDKLALLVEGVAIAERAGTALLDAGVDELILVGGDHTTANGLHARRVPDLAAGQGPLQAVIAALRAAANDWVAVVAGDMPDVEPQQIRELLRIAALCRADAVIPQRTVVGVLRREVLCACYHRRGIALLQAAFDAGERSITRAIERLDVHVVNVTDGPGWADLDTPLDARRRGAVPPEPGRPEPVLPEPVLPEPKRAPTGGSSSSASVADVPEIETVDVETLRGLLQSPITLIDVREPDEFTEARVPGARLVPLATVADSVHEFPTDRPVYVICHSGGRSQRAAEWLTLQGISAVNVAGGTAAWVQAGFEADSGPVNQP